MNAIEVSNLKKSYGSKVVVDNVTLTIREGDIYGLVGRNGAGKTTLIRMILGLASPIGGEIVINGAKSPDALNYERKKIGSIVDTPAFEPHMSAFENMRAQAKRLGVDNEKKLRDILHIVGLNSNDRLKAKNFSLGMKQRLAIGIALISEPSILILDEPVNGLDPTGIFEVRELLKRLNTEKNVTILISSHLLSELAKLATSYGVMEKGKMVKELRGSDIEEMCRPFIKVVVGDLRKALNVVIENYSAHDFEILPYNTLALYNMEKGVADVAAMFKAAEVPIISLSQSQGDLEAAFITMMGGLSDENK
jgi:ABC-2 type transport system ATP-binding protein